MSNGRLGLRTRTGVITSFTQGARGIDADAVLFLNNVGIVDATITLAIQNLVIDLKAAGIWDKLKCIYPFVGGTAATHRYNLRDPRTVDAAYYLEFFGGWTHSITGALPNGTTGYADTKFAQNVLNNNSVSLSAYLRSNTSVSSFDIGGNSGNPNFFGAQLTAFYTGIGAISHLHSYPTDSAVSNTFTDTRAFYIGSRTSSTSNKLYRNASLLATVTTARTSTLPAVNFRLASDGVGYTNRELAFVSIGDGITDGEASDLWVAVDKFQTTLGRQV